MTDEQRLKVLGMAELRCFGGGCLPASVAINDILFDGKGELVMSLNKALWGQAMLVGHAGVRFEDKIWDGEGFFSGDDGLEEFLSWGMVDFHDPDYGPFLISEEEASEVCLVPVTRETMRNCTDPDRMDFGEEVDAMKRALKRCRKKVAGF